MGTYVARLASTFFRVFSVFRGSDSSPDWVAGDTRARLFVNFVVFFRHSPLPNATVTKPAR